MKHRELRLIEQEIAKTQVCIEQLRRCALIPYHTEVSLDPVASGEKSTDSGCPEFAPPHWTITNGPYTRHYQQWLLPDPKFDGYGPDGPPQALQRGGKSLRSQGMHDSNQSYTVTGRPQRQSAAKVQQRGASATVCTFNRSDGQLVRYVFQSLQALSWLFSLLGKCTKTNRIGLIKEWNAVIVNAAISARHKVLSTIAVSPTNVNTVLTMLPRLTVAW